MTNLKSMTGYGTATVQGENYRVTVEMKSVNHRYLEIFLRLPKQLNALEEGVKKQIQAALQRGKIDISLNYEQLSTKNIVVELDKDLAIAYHNSLVQLAMLCKLDSPVKIETLAALPGVLTQEKVEDDLEALAGLTEQAVAEALTQLIAMRQREGSALAADLQARLATVRRLMAEIIALAPGLAAEQQLKLRKRVEELLGDIAVDEARFANEIAFLADKADVNEELTRLASHCDQAEAILQATEPVGRRFDFLLQEMNREINTIGSKSNALNISNLVIDTKSELEKIREQVQNIE